MKPGLENKINIIGVMSGTSLDGLDIASVDFWTSKGQWRFELHDAKTISYSSGWKEKLILAPTLSEEELIELNAEYGKLIGSSIKGFIIDNNIDPELIASHGHTVFHQPEKGFTMQIGDGGQIAAITSIKTVSDFRTADVALGGQGAPLVPVGDKYLFHEYRYCLNLGGFSNISYEKESNRVAFDICPVNIILNAFAEKKGKLYDSDGNIGRAGNIDPELLQTLNQLPYYQLSPPKSLGREWIEKSFLPALESSNASDEDKLRTVYEHIAIQVSKVTGRGKLLLTGGGAFNTFLVKRIKALSAAEIVLPKQEIINYKEAIVFAFLGLLRVQNSINCFASVTGARRDSCLGVISFP